MELRKIKHNVMTHIKKVVNKWDTTKYIYIRVRDFYRKTRYTLKYKNKYPLDDRMIVFESYKGEQYSCNPRVLYEAIQADPAFKGYKKVWAFIHPEEFEWLAKQPGTRVVKYRTPGYFKAYAKAKYWFTNARLASDMTPKKDQIYLQTWHGTPLKRLGYDIVNYHGTQYVPKEHRYHYSSDAKRYTYMVGPSGFYKEKITSAFNLKGIHKEDIFIDCAYPRNDCLCRVDPEKIRSLKKQLGIPEDKRVILYAPTWRANYEQELKGIHFFLNIHFDKWQEACGEDSVILFRTHYLVKNSVDLTAFEGFVYNVSDYPDIRDLYLVSDVLVTDYSSVFFDYANLCRPMIFFMYDYEEYKNEKWGFYIDVKELPGPIVQTEEELVRLLPSYDGTGYEEAYKVFNDKFNPYRDGNGTEIVLRTIFRT
ncbi:MAG: CDP-glycerol glycerophosphotransferase family protein [Blautia sp.]|nr:CDP-glycerol glycerophosphotransferase family protein [Blautia sp.]